MATSLRQTSSASDRLRRIEDAIDYARERLAVLVRLRGAMRRLRTDVTDDAADLEHLKVSARR